jgi:beta-N-acetylhexosaminidase
LDGPPDLAPGAMGSPSVSEAQGEATGHLLRSVGINVDLAPVADVEGSSGSFLGSRSFGFTPRAVAARACAFASGLQRAGVDYTLKHFPGLGLASTSTDSGSVTLTASADQLRADYQPYRECGSRVAALIMVSSAIYPAITGSIPAVLSPEVYGRELSEAGSSEAITVSDDMEAPALVNQTTPGLRALQAGLDLLLYSDDEAASETAYTRLRSDVDVGALSSARIRAAYRAVLALKQRVAR